MKTWKDEEELRLVKRWDGKARRSLGMPRLPRSLPCSARCRCGVLRAVS